MRLPIRIALIGESGAGKSATALFLAEELHCGVIKTGSIPRQIARLLFGNDDKASTQRLDDALTQLDDSIFLRAALRGVDLDGSAVIDSLRFRSDVSLAASLNFTTLRVVAPSVERIERLRARSQAFDPDRDGAHRSEVELADFAADATVHNDGPIEDLFTQLRTLLGQFA